VVGVGVGVGVGTTVAMDVAVGVAEGVGVAVADADAEAEDDAALDVAGDVLLAALLLLVDDVQPAIDNEATITITKIIVIISRFIFDSPHFMLMVAMMPPLMKTTLSALFDCKPFAL
jgi:hypothetical protein